MTKPQVILASTAMVFLGYVAALLTFCLAVGVVGAVHSGGYDVPWYALPFVLVGGVPFVAMMLLPISISLWHPLAFVLAALVRVKAYYFYAFLGAGLVAHALSQMGIDPLTTKAAESPVSTTIILLCGALAGLAYWAVACHLADRWMAAAKGETP